MVEASKSLVNVFVDCDWGKKNTDLSTKYSVRGYPTVIFTDSKGTLIEPLGDRSPAGMKAQIEKIAKANTKAVPQTWDEISKAATKDGKPVLFLFTTKGKESAALEEALFDDSLAELREKFVIASSAISRDSADAKRFGVSTSESPVILVLDASAEKPEAAPLKKIVGKKNAKELLKELSAVKLPKNA